MLAALAIGIARLIEMRAWRDKEAWKSKTALHPFVARGLVNKRHSNQPRWPASLAI